MNLELVLARLAEVHSVLRSAEGLAGMLAWRPSGEGKKTEFRREVTKFWVRAEDEVAVVARILHHLPLYSGRRASAPAAAEPRTDGEMGQWVSSVYVDTASFESYHSRLTLDHGAQLVRFRFYGLDALAASTVYVERKTHKDKWTGERSVKARMPLPPVRPPPSLPPPPSFARGRAHE